MRTGWRINVCPHGGKAGQSWAKLGNAGQGWAIWCTLCWQFERASFNGNCVIRGNWKFHLATTGGWPSCSFQDPGHCNWQEQDNLARRSLSHNVRNCSGKCSCLVSTKPPLLKLKPITVGTTRKLERYGQKSAIDQEIDWSKDDWKLEPRIPARHSLS